MNVEVQLNGEVYHIDSIGTDIETNFPEFDTLFFPTQGNQHILCNFKPDSSYLVSGACCATLDIIPYEKMKAFKDSFIWIEDIELEMNRIQEYTLDVPTFSFQLKGKSEDSIYFWSADYACEPKIRLATNTPQEYGSAWKCFYWSNITVLQFYTSSQSREYMIGEDGQWYDYLPDFEEIEDCGTLAVRLFDNHHFLVTLDVITNEISLSYDD